MSSLKNVIFDFDGTLFDSMYVWQLAGELFLHARGKEPSPTMRSAVRSLSVEQAALYFKREYNLNETPEHIVSEIYKGVEYYYRNEIQPRIGVREFLEELRARGIRMCIATASQKELVGAALVRNHLDSYFEKIFTCSEVGHGKDEPDIFRSALEYFGGMREDTVVIDDSLYSIETACRDGFLTVGIFDQSELNQDLLKEKSDCYLLGFEDRSTFWIAEKNGFYRK
ncbi:MAG: HAD family hydrolase [Thermoguttaceae bacterium]